MKRMTPLKLAAYISFALAVLSLIYMLLSGAGGNLGPLISYFLVFAGAIFYTVHWVIAKSGWQSRTQFYSELAITIIVCLFFFKSTGVVRLHISNNYNDYIVIVYGVEGQPSLHPGLLRRNTNINVPPDGIILTGHKGGGKRILLCTNENGAEKEISPGYGIATHVDTLYYHDKKFVLDEFAVLQYPGGWKWDYDTARRNRKLDQVTKRLDSIQKAP